MKEKQNSKSQYFKRIDKLMKNLSAKNYLSKNQNKKGKYCFKIITDLILYDLNKIESPVDKLFYLEAFMYYNSEKINNLKANCRDIVSNLAEPTEEELNSKKRNRRNLKLTDAQAIYINDLDDIAFNAKIVDNMNFINNEIKKHYCRIKNSISNDDRSKTVLRKPEAKKNVNNKSLQIRWLTVDTDLYYLIIKMNLDEIKRDILIDFVRQNFIDRYYKPFSNKPIAQGSNNLLNNKTLNKKSRNGNTIDKIIDDSKKNGKINYPILIKNLIGSCFIRKSDNYKLKSLRDLLN